MQIEVANNFLRRLIGLIGRASLPIGHGMLITKCNGIHMCFMSFPIDVVYTDENFRIKKMVSNLKPWIGFSMCLGASNAIELATGEIQRLRLEVGQTLALI